MSFKERLEKLQSLLQLTATDGGGGQGIDLPALKQLVFHGLPGDSTHRPLVWRLLLDYLPADSVTGCGNGGSVSGWPDYLSKKRSNYENFITDLLTKKEESFDHPLNPNPESQWLAFFKDNDVLLQIDKDVRRLLPEISFFQSLTEFPSHAVTSGKISRLHQRVQYSSLQAAQSVKKGGLAVVAEKCDKKAEIETIVSGECHWEVVERILFIYAKLNPGQGYVQGMNEIIGPIYYTLANDNNVLWRAHAEADTFYMFTNLMGEIRDFFIRSLDNSKSGIKSMMEKLMNRVKQRDQQIFNLLSFQDIHPQYFAFRWISLLLSQEFPLPDVLRIWDSLLADRNRFDFLIDLCCAMIMHIRGELLTSDFSSNMKLLQNYPPIDVRDILHLATTFSTIS